MRYRVGLFVLATLVLVAVACGPATTPQQPTTSVKPAAEAKAPAAKWTPELTKIIQEAEKEGELQLVWGEGMLGGSETARSFEPLMSKLFGTNIRVKFTPGAATEQIGNQIAVEYAANQKAVSDVFPATAIQIAPLAGRQIFQSVDWLKLTPRIKPEMVEQDFALRVFTGLSGVTYNTQLLPGGKVPESLEDFLKPEWKGKIASTPYAAGLDFVAAEEVWGATKTLEYVKKLSGQVTGLIRCGETERVASGEFSALVMDCMHSLPLLWKAKGAPVDFMIPKDAAQKRYYYLTIPKNAAHPNAAKLFTVLMLSEEGQALLWDTARQDLHFFPESRTRPMVDELEKKGVKFFEPTVKYVADHPELSKVKDDMVKILTGK